MSDDWSTERLQRELDACPAIVFHGLRVDHIDADKGELVMAMPLKPELERSEGSGQFHGGPVATLIDTAGDFAVALKVGGGVPTMNFRVDYLRPCTGPEITATARVRKMGARQRSPISM